jgi:hypothetical protein
VRIIAAASTGPCEPVLAAFYCAANNRNLLFFRGIFLRCSISMGH